MAYYFCSLFFSYALVLFLTKDISALLFGNRPPKPGAFQLVHAHSYIIITLKLSCLNVQQTDLKLDQQQKSIFSVCSL